MSQITWQLPGRLAVWLLVGMWPRFAQRLARQIRVRALSVVCAPSTGLGRAGGTGLVMSTVDDQVSLQALV